MSENPAYASFRAWAQRHGARVRGGWCERERRRWIRVDGADDLCVRRGPRKHRPDVAWRPDPMSTPRSDLARTALQLAAVFGDVSNVLMPCYARGRRPFCCPLSGFRSDRVCCSSCSSSSRWPLLRLSQSGWSRCGGRRKRLVSSVHWTASCGNECTSAEPPSRAAAPPRRGAAPPRNGSRQQGGAADSFALP